MTTYVSGTNYAKAIAPDATNKIGPGTWGGRVRVMHDTYTTASTASGVVIRMGKLPAGAKVIGVCLQFAALGSGVTLAVGNGGSGQGAIFSAATTATTASTGTFKNLIGASAYTVGTLSGDDVMTVTTGGATATGAISLDTFYVVD
jgi:hypothetical protein